MKIQPAGFADPDEHPIQNTAPLSFYENVYPVSVFHTILRGILRAHQNHLIPLRYTLVLSSLVSFNLPFS